MPRYSHFLTLTQAYDRLGHHMFGTDWTGHEIDTYTVDPPEKLSGQRRSLQEQIDQWNRERELAKQEIRKSVSEEDIASLKEKISKLGELIAPLNQELALMPRPDDSYVRDYEACLRRDRVQSVLLRGIASDEITATVNGSRILETRRMEDGKDYKLYFDLSIVVMSRRLSSRRRGTVMFKPDEFEKWMERVAPEGLPDNDPRFAEQKFAEFLRSEAATGKRWRKADMQKVALERFGVGTGAFRRIWESNAPVHWKRKGRPKTKK